MSFVTAVVAEGFVSVTTDGRAQKDGKVVNENAVKHKRPRNNIVIAYTGIMEACEEVLILSGVSYVHDSLELIASKISRRLTNEVYSEVKLSFIIAGQNSHGRNQLSVVSNHAPNEHLIPGSAGDFKISHLGSEQLSRSEDIYNLAFLQYKRELSQINNLIQIPGIQTRFNNAIADSDDSVNRNVQYILF